MIVWSVFSFYWGGGARGTCTRLGPCGRLATHLDPLYFLGFFRFTPFQERSGSHQSSMSSYTLSSNGRANDGCILCREYFSWRRSPTSLMTLSACGHIYTIKKLSLWKAICGSGKFRAAPSKIFMEKHIRLVRLNHKHGLKQKKN